MGLVLAAGFDAVVVDREHGVMGAETAALLVTAAHAAGGLVLVRVPSLERAHVQDALEAGADGILAPMVESPEAAAQLANWCRYPPVGTRGFHPLTAASGHGRVAAPAHPTHANARVLVAVQVETAPGLESCEAIARVPGVDLVFLGPGDLALSLGVSPGAPALAAAAARIATAARDSGKGFGAFVRDGGSARDAVALGASLLVASADVALLHGAARALAAELPGAGT